MQLGLKRSKIVFFVGTSNMCGAYLHKSWGRDRTCCKYSKNILFSLVLDPTAHFKSVATLFLRKNSFNISPYYNNSVQKSKKCKKNGVQVEVYNTSQKQGLFYSNRYHCQAMIAICDVPNGNDSDLAMIAIW